MKKYTYLVLFNKTNECGPLDFNRLARSIVQGYHKMEEVGFPKVRRWLLFEMGPSNCRPAQNKRFHNLIKLAGGRACLKNIDKIHGLMSF